jgi:NAD+ synthase (glutamine-hydrolysing)
VSLVDRAEYKRRQVPTGIKVTSRSFGRDRRMPITNRYREEDRDGHSSGRAKRYSNKHSLS